MHTHTCTHMHTHAHTHDSGEEIFRLSLERGSFLSPLRGGCSGINVLGVHPSQGMLVAGPADGELQCWDPRQRAPLGGGSGLLHPVHPHPVRHRARALVPPPPPARGRLTSSEMLRDEGVGGAAAAKERLAAVGGDDALADAAPNLPKPFC